MRWPLTLESKVVNSKPSNLGVFRDEQGAKMWVKQEDCQGEGGTERDDEYQEGDEKEGQIEQEWDDALNERYGLEVRFRMA